MFLTACCLPLSWFGLLSPVLLKLAAGLKYFPTKQFFQIVVCRRDYRRQPEIAQGVPPPAVLGAGGNKKEMLKGIWSLFKPTFSATTPNDSETVWRFVIVNL